MDPLEDRIRQGLSADSWRLPADDELLSRVHAGAVRRRRRRAAAGVAASVVVLGGLAGAGAFVLNDLNGPSNVVAGDAETTNDSGAENPEQPGPLDEPQEDGSDNNEQDTEQNDPPTSEEPHTNTVDEVPADFRTLSVTAISTETYWVLGADPAEDEHTPLARTNNGGDGFGVVGEIPAPPPPEQAEPTEDSVSDVRFADEANGWAYGNALWSTHDGGRSWQEMDDIPGSVVFLEAADGYAYAIANDSGSYSLWRTAADEDAWEQRQQLASPADLAVTGDQVLVTDRPNEEAQLVSSNDHAETFQSGPSPCQGSLGAGALGASTDGIWLVCPSGTSATLQVSTDGGQNWDEVEPERTLGNVGSSPVGSPDGNSLVAATTGEVVQVNADGTSETAPVEDLEAPLYVGFTDPSVGYVVDSDGGLYRTEDGSTSWNRVQVD